MADLAALELRLRAILEPYRDRLEEGTICFNFTTIDAPLFAELASVAAKGVARHPALVATALVADPKHR